MIRVISKKSLQFKLQSAPCSIDAQVSVSPGKVTSLPDWVQEDPIYGWCVADGTLEVIA